MTNLSKIKRERMLSFLEKLKDQETDNDILVAIGEIENELISKKYGLVWEEHEEEVDVKIRDNVPVFIEIGDREITEDNVNSYNFLLEGDNLHSLKLLEKTHEGKIDVIYIDPPYNTGNKDFVYEDTYVDKKDGYYHSKWLSFMNERLKIARKLLSNNGVIFISIDDNEQAQLKLLCDEIFNEENVETNIWSLIDKAESTFEKTAGYTTRKEHEYLITIRKNTKFKFKKYKDKIEFSENSFSNPDNDPRGKWFSGNMSRTGIKTTTGSKYYTITTPTGHKYTRNWTLSKKEYENALKDGRIYFSKNGSGVPRYKIFENDKKETIQSSIFSGLKTSITGKNQLKEVLGFLPFKYPKPIELIMRILEISSDKDSLILDFFAGSGTTGHAVMQLNKKDGGNRRFILCTNNENKICEEITYERLRKVIYGYGENLGIPTNLKYYRTDFVPKDVENLSNELIKHIKEMVQLEHGVRIDNNEYMLILSDEDADQLESNWENENQLKALYVSQEVLFTARQTQLFNKVEVHVIPDYYFGLELKEVGEAW